jgi:hypothetical protein
MALTVSTATTKLHRLDENIGAAAIELTRRFGLVGLGFRTQAATEGREGDSLKPRGESRQR